MRPDVRYPYCFDTLPSSNAPVVVTRIDFYLLKDVDLTAMHRFACRLAARALGAGNRIHIHADDEKAAVDLDELLWCYPERRFIPHTMAAADFPENTPISIGWEEPNGRDDVLINLASDIPGFFGRFERVAEIVVGDRKALGRDRYKFYRDRGYPLFHHDIDEWESS